MNSSILNKALRYGVAIAASLALSSCLQIEQTENSSSGIDCAAEGCVAAKASSCEQLSGANRSYTSQLELDAVNPTLIGIQSGEFHPDASFNKIEELGRIGCASSADILVSEAGRELATAQLSTGGVYQLEYLGTRRVQAIVDALRYIPGERSSIIPLLSWIAADQRLFGDGYAGNNIQLHAQDALAYLRSSIPAQFASVIKRTPVSWDSNWLGVCSSNYLLVDGSRSGYIANFSTYIEQWEALSPSASILQDMIQEPFYCDGQNGFSAQSAALARLAMSDPDQEAHLVTNVLVTSNYRGHPFIPDLIQHLATLGLDQTSPASSTFDDELASVIDTANPHRDETARAGVIEILSRRCSYGNATAEFCHDTFLPLVRHYAKKDLYFIVRFEAHRAIKAAEGWEQN